jgi:PAS domain S-box-containing protein
MANSGIRNRRIFYAAAAAVISLCALSGWITGNLVLASVISGSKAMAPLTAFSVLLISAAVISYNENKTTNIISFILALSVIVVLLFVTADRAGLFFVGFEHALIPASLVSTITEVNIGILSPLTIVVLFVSSSVLLICSAVQSKCKYAIVFICGGAVVFAGVIVIIGYVLHNPILSGIISLPTGMSYVMYGLAFIMLADQESFPARMLLGNTIAAIILRRLIPLIIIFIIIQGFFAHLPELFQYEKVFIDAVIIVMFVVFSILISVRASSVMSRKIVELTDERDLARHEYYKSESKYKTLVESLQEGIAVIDMQGVIEYSNPRLSEILCTRSESIEGKSFFDFIVSGKTAREYFQKNNISGGIENNDFEIVRSDGKRMVAAVTFVPFSGSDYTYHGAIAGVVDITDKKYAEESLKESLANKETLMRELFHRTKNNMQVICAFIRIKYYTLEDGDQKDFLKSLENRILAMSLIHEKLYESKNLSRIDIEKYTYDLSRLLISQALSGKCKIKTDINMKGIIFPIEIATTYGLILTELIINSCKYAFKDRKSGVISIITFRNDNNTVELLYRDDGPGLPDNFALEKISTFGMKMISDLVMHQLHGSLAVEKGNGFFLRICFTNMHPDTPIV